MLPHNHTSASHRPPAQEIGFLLYDSVRLVCDSVVDIESGIGIYIESCAAFVDSCYVSGCERGILAFESAAVLEDNVIEGPGLYGISLAKDFESPGTDTASVFGNTVTGYFLGGLLSAGAYAHCRIDGCVFTADTNVSGQFPYYNVRASTDAWVYMRNSKIIDYATAGFYSYKSNANLGELPDTGFNAIYVTGGPTNCEPKSAIHVAPGGFGFGPGPPQQVGLKAEGNWWGTDSPQSCWFTLIDYTPWLDADPLAKRLGGFAAQANVPDEFSLGQNYPNPFNPATVIEFQLPAPSRVRVEVFNILGQRIKVLADNMFPAGRHRLEWDGTDSQGRTLSSGVYLYRVVAGSKVEAKKMVLLR